MQERKIYSEEEKKSFRITQQSGPYSIIGHQIKNTRRDTRRKRKAIADVSLFGSHNLILDKSALEIDGIFSSGLLQHGTIEDIIRDIFPFIEKEIPIDDDIFDEDTRPIDFLNWMISSYDKVNDSEQWSISYSTVKNRYYLQSIYEVKGIETKGYSVELDFLPILSKDNRGLYDLFVGLLGLFTTAKVGHFFFDNDELDYAIEYIQEEVDGDDHDDENVDEINRIKDYLMVYKSGNAKIIENEIKSSEITIESLKENLRKFKTKCDTEKRCIKFIKKSIKILDFKESFYDYIHVLDNEMEEGFPVSPLDYSKFDWNYDEENPISQHQQMMINSNWGEYGDIPFRYSVINNNKKEPSKFIKKYLEMISEMCDLSYLIKNQGA